MGQCLSSHTRTLPAQRCQRGSRRQRLDQLHSGGRTPRCRVPASGHPAQPALVRAPAHDTCYEHHRHLHPACAARKQFDGLSRRNQSPRRHQHAADGSACRSGPDLRHERHRYGVDRHLIHRSEHGLLADLGTADRRGDAGMYGDRHGNLPVGLQPEQPLRFERKPRSIRPTSPSRN